MKKVLFLIVIMLVFSTAYTQDLINAIQKMTLDIDSLQKQVIKPLNDSIINLNAIHSVQIAKLNEQINLIESEKNELNSKIIILEKSLADLNRNKIKIERDNLQKQMDSLALKVNELNKTINAKELQILQEKELSLKKTIEEKEKGKQEVRNQIIQTYNKTLDELIKTTNLKIVERDISIVGDKSEVHQKLLSLLIYFNSQQVLNEKYSEQKVENAITQLKTIEQTEFVTQMIDLLDKYKLRNDALKETIVKILEIDKQFLANDDYTQKTKLNDILSELAWYFRNYRFNFKDYPYLSEVVMEIIKLKQSDANAAIASFLEKL